MWVAANWLYYANAKRRAYSPFAQVIKPPSKVSINLTAFREPTSFLERCLESIAQQNVIESYPEMFELIIIGAEGIDMALAEEYARALNGRVLVAQHGKLTARADGIHESSGEIIWALDADVFVPPNVGNMMLQPFHDPEVTAVEGNADHGKVVLDRMMSIPIYMNYRRNLLGRNSAFTKSAYEKVGGFNLQINQHSMSELLAEEEYGFRQKLEQIGKVADVNAPVLHLGEQYFLTGRSGGERGLHPTVEDPAARQNLPECIEV